MIFLINLFLIVFSFLISKKLIKLFVLKLKEKFIDYPNSRSNHKVPTPRGVGVIFVFITISASLIYLLIYGYSNIYIIPILAIPLAIIGIIDDLYKISSLLRFFFHIFTSSCIFFSGNLIAIKSFENNYFSFLFPILIIFIFTAVINFINFMDGIDGLVGGSLPKLWPLKNHLNLDTLSSLSTSKQGLMMFKASEFSESGFFIFAGLILILVFNGLQKPIEYF